MPDSLPQQLWQARLNGSLVDIADEDMPTQDAAYTIQAETIKLAPVQVTGFKIGATSEAAMEALGVDGPVFGPMFDGSCYDSGAKVTLSAQQNAMLETEFAVGLAADLPTREAPYTTEEVANVVAWVSPAFEIVASRFSRPLKGNGNLLVADCGSNHSFVGGPRTTDLSSIDLNEHPATLTINGKEIANGHSGMTVLGNPLGTVAWLASHPKLRDRGLKAGDILSTGTCTGLTPISIGDVAQADFGPLGTVSASFVSK